MEAAAGLWRRQPGEGIFNPFGVEIYQLLTAEAGG